MSREFSRDQSGGRSSYQLRMLFESTFATKQQLEEREAKNIAPGILNLSTINAFLEYLNQIDQIASERLKAIIEQGPTANDAEFISHCGDVFAEAVSKNLLEINKG